MKKSKKRLKQQSDKIMVGVGVPGDSARFCYNCGSYELPKDGESRGECRGEFPVRDEDTGNGVWPQTLPNEWCGRWELRGVISRQVDVMDSVNVLEIIGDDAGERESQS